MSSNTKSVEIFTNQYQIKMAATDGIGYHNITNQYQIKMAATDDIGYHKNLHRVVLFAKWGMWETPFEGSVQDEAAGMLRPWSSGLSPAV